LSLETCPLCNFYFENIEIHFKIVSGIYLFLYLYPFLFNKTHFWLYCFCSFYLKTVTKCYLKESPSTASLHFNSSLILMKSIYALHWKGSSQLHFLVKFLFFLGGDRNLGFIYFFWKTKWCLDMWDVRMAKNGQTGCDCKRFKERNNLLFDL
jgi:hypothetical protein